ncbi:hypothetical protein [Streptomyces ambofaciens]|uniref:hypothetical protein n=1 Tax=Streptomyces ambofaciens TaxID=1889 RepID=UPI000B33C543|nr:hypothetical protein [Streptomyces ambofaciens]
MTDFSFELTPFFKKKVQGRSGIVGEFGEVTVEVERRKGFSKTPGIHCEVRLRGDKMPEVTYQTVGPGRPTLKNSRLTAAGHLCKMSYNTKGLTNASRALQVICQERVYEYCVTSHGKGATLRRPGVAVTLNRAKGSASRGTSSFGAVTGEADSLDLALAVVFECVDTLELTTAGAVSETLNRLLYNPRWNEPTVD